MANPAPVPTRMEIQITGIRKHFAECVTEQDDGEMCGGRSSDWDSPLPANAWIRAHSDVEGHTKFKKHAEEDVTTFTEPARVR
ncbi:hypothetical protein [Streptomyces paromomycinus]|uniref:Uncharacterized protein n=1 Tax=Streptomyces paromomycinus TaxID=92743 RepID=A0A401VX44_STREY|nr:hypothetical protein [Streptomyces paromomycinus]GCD41638.1 hypothetical protein GKJPGBOP_01294 [Streptomyces paromomycinus]